MYSPNATMDEINDKDDFMFDEGWSADTKASAIDNYEEDESFSADDYLDEDFDDDEDLDHNPDYDEINITDDDDFNDFLYDDFI